MKLMQIKENANYKVLESKDFNYIFNKNTGYHMQWGATKEEDPLRSPYGPVIADIEILNKCKGPGGKLCPFCYKSNTLDGEYMTLEEFKTVFSKLPKTLTQIALGADADCTLSPDLFPIMEYIRSQGVVPNITVADITKETAKKLGDVAGAVAVSWYGVYSDKKYCYNSIDYLTEHLDQVNMHFMLSKETLPYVDELIEDIKTDPRLSKLNAVVFLSLKQKGRGVKYKGCTDEEFKSVVDRMTANGIGFGFDSCSAPKYKKAIANEPNAKELMQYAEHCESFSQSIYVNEKGVVYPCSFMEKMPWNKEDYSDSEGWDLLDDSIKTPQDFISKIWNSERAQMFSLNANMCAECGNGCQLYEV
jgi:hypothetical protein